MYNVVFIDVEKVGSNLGETVDSLEQLNNLARNIEKISDNAASYVVTTVNGDIEKELYDAKVLNAYFDTISRVNPKIIAGGIISADNIIDNTLINTPTPVNKSLEIKKSRIISKIGKKNIKKILHLTNGIDFELLNYLSDLDNISLTEGFADHQRLDGIRSCFGKETTYLISEKDGLEGFNDCFDTYFENQSVLKIVK